jgi:DNA-binding response OmpR family regulator
MRPKVLLAHHSHLFRTKVRKPFRRQGVDLTVTSSAQAAHLLVRSLDPDVTILDARLRDESGFLTCAKLRSAYPTGRVVIVGRRLTSEERRFARFCGAEASVEELMGVEALVGHVLDVLTPA